MRTIKVFSIIIFLIIFLLNLFFQVRVELYKENLRKNYDFDYLKKERVRYTPFVYFVFCSKILKQNKCYFRKINVPYETYEKEHQITRMPYEEYNYIYNIEFNAYLMYCYFKKSELDCAQ